MQQILIPNGEDFPKTAEAVVIGGGIVGTATAFWLSRAAAETLALLSETIPFWDQIAAGLKSSEVVTSAGQYVSTPDDQPLIGEVKVVPGAYLNCGYWAGVMLAPGAGKRIDDLVTGRLSPQENPLRPSRYQEGIHLKGSSFRRGR